MEREKMIEEMAKELNCLLSYAEMVYNLNYRKIPVGAVVLTKEEYERLKKEELYAQGKYNLCHGNRSLEAIAKTTEQTGQILIDYDRRIRKAYDEIIPKLLEENKQVRKETAKEIYKRLCNVEYSIYDDAHGYAGVLLSEFEKIFNEYGVEVEE